MTISDWLITDPQGNILVNTADQQQLDLAALGANEVIQNLVVIFSTRIGSVMGDRLFGTSHNYVDAPQNVAQMMIVANVCVAMSHFEPRAQFRKIDFAPNGVTGQMNAKLSVNIDLSQVKVASR